MLDCTPEQTAVCGSVSGSGLTACITQCSCSRADDFLRLQSHQGRFTAAYIDQFARAEVQSLRQRTAPQPPGSVAQCFCVAAQRPDSDRIVGTADLLPPAACTSVKLPQIPEVCSSL